MPRTASHRTLLLALLTTIAVSFGLAACSSSDYDPGDSCGPGRVLINDECVPNTAT